MAGVGRDENRSHASLTQVGNWLFPMHQIQEQKVVGDKRSQSFLADLFQKPQELRVLDFAVQGERDLVFVAMAEVRLWFALANALFKDPVHPLTCPLNQATACKGLSESPVARCLPPKDVVQRDAGRISARTHDLQATGVLVNKYRPG